MAVRSELTLLQRIALGEEGAKKPLTITPEKLRDSIQQHLQDMFNTRKGDALANPEYGLPDFNELDMAEGFESAIDGIKRAIKQHLSLYESRLNRVRVNFIKNEDDPTDLMFEITASLNIKGKHSRVRFEANMFKDAVVKVTT